jgi:hypothetical protein
MVEMGLQLYEYLRIANIQNPLNAWLHHMKIRMGLHKRSLEETVVFIL